MNDIILAAVNDSSAGFSSAEVAVEYARRLGGQLHAVTVVPLDALGSGDVQLDGSDLAARRDKDAEAVLRHVSALGAAAGVDVVGHLRHGPVSSEILEQAKEIDAGLVVMALVDRPSHAMPYIGSNTLQVMEFATMPILVVPIFHGGTSNSAGA